MVAIHFFRLVTVLLRFASHGLVLSYMYWACRSQNVSSAFPYFLSYEMLTCNWMTCAHIDALSLTSRASGVRFTMDLKKAEGPRAFRQVLRDMFGQPLMASSANYSQWDRSWNRNCFLSVADAMGVGEGAVPLRVGLLGTTLVVAPCCSRQRSSFLHCLIHHVCQIFKIFFYLYLSGALLVEPPRFRGNVPIPRTLVLDFSGSRLAQYYIHNKAHDEPCAFSFLLLRTS